MIISNGFASMGIALPGAIAAALVHPDRHVVALCGDGGLLMNVQELETAVRLGVRVTIVVWRDDGYGLIDWKQRNEFGRPFGVSFGNPDFVALAQSFGMAAFRPSSSADLAQTLRRALDVAGPSLVEVPIDYRENLRLTEHLAASLTDRLPTPGGPIGGQLTDSPGPHACTRAWPTAGLPIAWATRGGRPPLRPGDSGTTCQCFARQDRRAAEHAPRPARAGRRIPS